MEKMIQIGILYQYYKDLLSDKQSEAIEQYYLEDLSLTEIAELEGVSKQAISRNIKRAERLLLDYEDKLGLYKRNKELVGELDKLKDLLIDHTNEEGRDLLIKQVDLLISKLN